MSELFFTLLGLFVVTIIFNQLKELRIYIKASEIYERDNKDKKYSDTETLSEENIRYWYKAIEELKK